MKKIFRFAVLLSFTFVSLHSYAQNNGPQLGCKDPYILTQAKGLKEGLQAQGFEVLNDAMLSMQTREDFPVVVRMKQGEFYQVVFVGNTRSNKMNLELFDSEHKSLLHKEQKPMQQTSNVISFSYTPETSGDYMFVLSQVIKQKTSCGSFTILRLKSKETKK